MLSREQINTYYQGALEYFNNNYPQFLCTIEQNTFVIQLNYQNEKYFSGMAMPISAKTYRCVVKILRNGKFCMSDVYVDNEMIRGLGGFDIKNVAFAGRSISFHYETVLDQNENTGEISFKKYKFSTSDIQKPVKKYFMDLGLKYKFYSYSLNIQSLPKEMRIVSVVVPMFCGIIFTLFGFLFEEMRYIFIIVGLGALLWGVINLVCLLRKDE